MARPAGSPKEGRWIVAAALMSVPQLIASSRALTNEKSPSVFSNPPITRSTRAVEVGAMNFSGSCRSRFVTGPREVA